MIGYSIHFWFVENSQAYHQLNISFDITPDSTWESTFSSNAYVALWLSWKNTSFENLNQKVITIPPVATTYLCEAEFSAYTATKIKYQTHLNILPDLRIQPLKIKPDIA